METDRVPVKEAAKEIGVSEAYLRQQMRRGEWDLGHVTPPPRGSHSNIRYLVFRSKLDRFLGRTKDDDGDNQDNHKDNHGPYGNRMGYRGVPAGH